MNPAPIVIPTKPFDPEVLAARARELQDLGCADWEFDWLTPSQAEQLWPALERHGVNVNLVGDRSFN